MQRFVTQLLCHSPASIDVMMTFLKADFLKGMGSWFNKWTRSVQHSAVTFAALNASLTEVENIHRQRVDLTTIMSSSDVKTCVSASRRFPDNMSNDLGSILDNVEHGHDFAADLHFEHETSKKSDSSFFNRPFLVKDGLGSQEDLKLWPLDLGRTFSQYSAFRKSEFN